MRKLGTSVLFAVLSSSCSTTDLEVPLPSVHMMRPSAGRKPFAVRLGFGLAQGPEVQGVTGAVHAPGGAEDNAVPDYRNDSEGFFSHGDYTTHPALDLGLNFMKFVDVGWSSSRGLYAFVNVLDLESITLSISPSYYYASQNSRDRNTSLESGDRTFSASVTDKSWTGILSYFVGSRQSLGFTVYGGLGFHNLTVSAKDHRTQESTTAHAEAQTRLIGLGLDSRFGGMFLEQAWTEIPQRNGLSPEARSFSFGGNFLLGSSGSSK